ncbi:MAG: hypothetical protein ACRDIB_11570, partial [Ardenticatenaceae bacterium]
GDDGAGGGAPPRPQPSPEAIDQTITLLDALPTPLTVVSLLEWLHGVTTFPRPERFFLRAIPFFDDLRDPLDTLITWDAMSAAEIRDHLVATVEATESFILQTLAGVLDDPLGELVTLSTQFQQDALAESADELTTRLGELRTAINSGDLGATGPAVAAINARLDQYDAVRPDLESDVLEPLLAPRLRVAALPDELEERMAHILSVLQPSGALGDLTNVGEWPQPALPPESEAAFDELATLLGGYLTFFQELADIIDVQALQEPLSTAAQAARDAVDGLDQALVSLTLTIQEQFSEVQALLDGIDTDALTAAAEEAIDDFKDEVVEQLSDAFAPVREAIQQVVGAIDEAVDEFDPAAIITELQNTIQAITDVLQGP